MDNIAQVKECAKECGELQHAREEIAKLRELLDVSDRQGDKVAGQLDGARYAFHKFCAEMGKVFGLNEASEGEAGNNNKKLREVIRNG